VPHPASAARRTKRRAVWRMATGYRGVAGARGWRVGGR
jgi:hypothetical protein